MNARSHCSVNGNIMNIKEDVEGRRWLEEGLAQASGDGRKAALFALGNMLYDGRGGPQDFAEAGRLFGLAAAQGHAEAQFTLGNMHRNGEGGPQDLAEARWLLGLAAAQGNARAQTALGLMHNDGEAGPQDFAEARRLFGLAAAQGDAGAQFTLGSMHRHGHGGPPNLAEARRLFGLAAAQGNAKAQVRLGKMHHRGQGGPADFAEARRLFGLAAAQATAQTAQPVDIGSLSLDALIQMVLLNNKRCSFACLGLPPSSPPVANQHGKGALACSRDGPALDPASLLVAALWVRGRALAVRMPGRVKARRGRCLCLPKVADSS